MTGGYKARSRKTFTLPSGVEVTVRNLVGTDFASVYGGLPPIFSSFRGEEGEQEKRGMEIQRILLEDFEEGKKIRNLFLCRAVVSPPFVDKQPYQCQGDETSIWEVTDADLLRIMTEVSSLAVLTTEDANRLKSFHGESAGGGNSPLDGENIRGAAEQDPS
jgi:hypothetical protein